MPQEHSHYVIRYPNTATIFFKPEDIEYISSYVDKEGKYIAIIVGKYFEHREKFDKEEELKSLLECLGKEVTSNPNFKIWEKDEDEKKGTVVKIVKPEKQDE